MSAPGGGRAAPKQRGKGVKNPSFDSCHICFTRFGTSEQREKYLPKIYSGEWLSAICVTDEFAGVDPVSTSATAVHDAAKGPFTNDVS